MDRQQKDFSPGYLAVVTSGLQFIGDLLLYPLDTLNTRIKAQKHQHLKFLQFAKETYKAQGFRPLWRGCATTLFTSFFPSTIYFYLYEVLTKWTAEKLHEKSKLKMAMPMILSGFSEAMALTILVPFEIVRTRLQVKSDLYKEYTSVWHALSETIRKQGFWRLYKSSNIFIVYMVTFTSTQFQLYELLRNYFTDSSLTSTIANTMISTATANIICNPLEVLLTRYALVDTTKKELNLFKMIRRIKEREGYSGFFKGFTAKFIITMLYSLAWFPVYDWLRNDYGSTLRD